MSFATGVKDDLTRVLSGKPCCRKAELAAFLRLYSHTRFSADGESLSLRMENAAVARKIFTLSKGCGLQTQLNMQRKASPKRNQSFSLRIPPQPPLAQFLLETGLSDDSTPRRGLAALPAAALSGGDCCQRSYLRGAFLAAGYISRPEGGYHVEISVADLRQALFLQKLLAGFELPAKMTRRKGLIILYLKEGEQISRFLSVIGSHRSLLEFESTRVDKDMRNRVNRLVNCDKANVDKTVDAALRQIERIRRIENGPGWKTLTPSLREAALLRLQYPEASLSELSEISGLGRSAINHRLRRLLEIADDY